jgi:hypothetical protein
MSTEKIRRELEALRAHKVNCRGCGYPSYPDTEVNVVWRRPGDPLPKTVPRSTAGCVGVRYRIA